VKNKPLPAWFVKVRGWICTQILTVYYTIQARRKINGFLKTHELGALELKMVGMGYRLTVEGNKRIYSIPGGEVKFTITRRTVTF
jgi:hypothetical protein